MVKRKKLIMYLAIIFALNILIILFAQSAALGAYRRGDSGNMVTKIQEKHKTGDITTETSTDFRVENRRGRKVFPA